LAHEHTVAYGRDIRHRTKPADDEDGRWRPANEAPGFSAHQPPLANSRTHRRLPARGCVGVADTRPTRRVPALRAADHLRAPVRNESADHARALGHPVEAR